MYCVVKADAMSLAEAMTHVHIQCQLRTLIERPRIDLSSVEEAFEVVFQLIQFHSTNNSLLMTHDSGPMTLFAIRNSQFAILTSLYQPACFELEIFVYRIYG